ncbi:isoprenylcysteine carboxylmethyltransferase family protein [Nitratireductor sp. CAU 1489]|uniref:Isoprenylcysteine carboxylmethyltransferase family protein n=1 Tax=Nitratireductor arenosus TaxID=2682096 RepID=A0A844QJ53_9HYPH|nr:isoprenylcysteine carboxylmethyltransferase family protein [Nitratireductor arenosus]MVA97951.1 isoprenylcysteine carboxylmethyltransferase family protein [Nitratireductor arenosus]
MSELDTRPNRFPWPPIIYLAAIGASLVLAWLLPLPWIGPPLSDILFAVGAVALVGVVLIDVSAMRTLARAKTTIMPHRGSDHLVTSGPFAFTRNPIYLANTLLMIGVGLMAGIVWFLGLAVIAAFLTQKLAIEREERHLTARFGKKYRDYAKKVRRWV